MTANTSNRQFITDLVKAKALEFEAADVQEVDVEGRCSYTDTFMIMSGTSSVRIKALAEKIIFECKHAGIPALSIEGLDDAEWCLLDFGEVIVNIMMPEKRDYFQLETLWSQLD